MEEQIKAKITEIIPLSKTTKAIRFISEKKINFLPGQFLMFDISIKDKIERLAFSLSSIPTEKYYEITVKKTQTPFISQYLVDSVKIGDEFTVSEPRGKFILDRKIKNILFLAAGSGIAPIISMIRFLRREKSKIKTHLIYSNKTQEDILWKDEIEQISRQNTNFSHEFIITNSDEGKRITEKNFKAFLNKETDFYICGPLEFVKDLYNSFLL